MKTLSRDAFTGSNQVLSSDIIGELEQAVFQLLSEKDEEILILGRRLFNRLLNDAIFGLRGAPTSFEIFFAKKVLQQQGFVYQVFAKAIANDAHALPATLFEKYTDSLSHVLMNDNWDLVMSAVQNHYYIGCLFLENKTKKVPIDEYLERTFTSLTTFLERVRKEKEHFGLQRVGEEVIHLAFSGIFIFKEWMLKEATVNYISHSIDFLNDLVDLPPAFVLQSVLNNRTKELLEFLCTSQPPTEESEDFGNMLEKATKLAFRSLKVTRLDLRVHSEAILHDLASFARYTINVGHKQSKHRVHKTLLEEIDVYLKTQNAWKNLPREEIFLLVFTMGLYAYTVGEIDLSSAIGKKLIETPGMPSQFTTLRVQFLIEKGFQLSKPVTELADAIEKYKNLIMAENKK